MISPRKMRSLLQKNRVFLHQLYSEDKKKTKQLLSVATNFQAKTLIHILRFICLSIIPIKENSRAKVKQSRRLPILNELRDSQAYQSMLKGSKEHKIDYLKKLVSLYPIFLYNLFNEPT